MIRVQIAYEESEEAVARVQAVLDDAALRDPNWNGAEFIIERDEYTCIPDIDGPAANVLFADIQRAVAGVGDG